MPDGTTFIGPADSLTEQIVEQGRVRIRTVPDHVPGKVFEEGDLLLTGRRRTRSQVPRIEGYASFEIHVDASPTHQLHQRTIRVTAFQNRDQWLEPCHHQQEEHCHEGFAAT